MDNIININDFHYILGQTIMYCQIIEYDIKLIYAAMLNGDLNDTLDMITNKKWTLGKTINELKKLDYSDNNHYISAEDYNYLKQMTEKRNHWCHHAYLAFIYNDNFERETKYEKECLKLIKDNERLSVVYRSLEKIRMQAMKDFNRI